MGLSDCSQVLLLSVLLFRTKHSFNKITKKINVFCGLSTQVALHACGIATDMVLEHCIQAGAAFVVSPCCYGFIQNAVKFSFPKRFVSAHRTSIQCHLCKVLLLNMFFLILLVSVPE